METFVSAISGAGFPEGEGARHYVVTCVCRMDLSGHTATPLRDGVPPQTVDGLLKDVVLAPSKSMADVALLQDGGDEAPRFWVEDASDQKPRPIAEPILGPTSSERFRHLHDYSEKQWAMAGGLRAVEIRREGQRPHPIALKMPASISREYFQVAPARQRFSKLTGEETIWVDRAAGRHWTRLPGGELALWAVDVAPAEIVRATLDTLLLGPEDDRALLVWRATLSRPLEAPPPRVVAELILGADGGKAAPPTGSARQDLLPMSTAEIAMAAAPVTNRLPPTGATDALPFKPVASSPGASDLDDEETQNTMTSLPADAALPFRGGPPAIPFAVPPPVAPPSMAAPAIVSPSTGTAPIATPMVTAPPPIPAPVPTGLPTHRAFPKPSYELAREEKERASLRPSTPAPPPLAPSVPPPAESASDLSLVPTDPPELEPEPEPAQEITLEVVALLDAEVQMKAGAEDSSLKTYRLTLSELATHETQWREAIAAEARQGKRDLQRRYDAAFLARVEELRKRPVSAEEYARIQVSVERQTTAEVLEELALPPRSMLVLTRVFSERTARSAELRQEIRERIVEARRA